MAMKELHKINNYKVGLVPGAADLGLGTPWQGSSALG